MADLADEGTTIVVGSLKEGLRQWRAMRRTYARFWVFTIPGRRNFWLDVISILVAVITNTVMIWLMGRPLSLIQAGDYSALIHVLALFAVVLLINQGVQFGGAWLTNWLELHFIGRVRNTMVARLLALSFPVASQFSKGDLLARLSHDVDRLSAILVIVPLRMVSHVSTLSLYVFMLFWIDAGLATLALLTTPLFLWHQRLFSPHKRRTAEQFLKSNGQLLAFEEQGLSNLRGISSNTAESFVSKLHEVAFNRARNWGVYERGLGAGFHISFTLLIYLIGLLIVLVGADSVRNGDFPVGALVSFLLYLGYLTVPIRGIADIAFQLVGNMPAAERVLQVFDANPMVQEKIGAPDLVVTKGGIEIKSLGFHYPNGTGVFCNMNVSIAGGETIALVGPSGSGKSTLAYLLLRFYDPQEGSIVIDGQDLTGVSIHSVRRNIAVVWQEPFLINGTLRDNLFLAAPDASSEQMEAACRKAHVWTFVSQLPDGLDTCVGAGGIELSGGQKQRLAIAQAFLRDAPILILDEASSALDSQSEQAIVQALNELRADRTTLMIAHRHSSIRSANRVIYFEGDGSLTAGKHEELFMRHTAYREAVVWQTHGADAEVTN